MGTLSNLTRTASGAFTRGRAAEARRRLLDTHGRMLALGERRASGYASVLRDLLRAYAAEGMVQADECVLLMQLASRAGEGVIVELGSYRGRSTIALALGSRRGAAAPVYAIEPHAEFTGVLGARFGPGDRLAFERNVERAGVAGLVHLISRPSEAAATAWTESIGLLWIDADHAYEAVSRDFALWTRYLTPAGRIALDDSTVAGLGPHRVVEEALASRRYEIADTVGKVTVLAPRARG